MRIVSIKENTSLEKRIAITPEIAKKYITLGLEVSLPENYGAHLGFTDQSYKDLGVIISNEEKDIINSANIIVQLGLPSDEKLSYLQENQNLIGVLNPYMNKEKIEIKVPLVIRLAGTNVEKGNKILRDSKLKYIEADTLEDAANKAVAALK